MSKKLLHISDTLTLPLDAATQTFAFIARKGAGKTYTAGKLVELLLDAAVQVVVLDTVGNWYGLRLSANGKLPGFDVPVLGGLRGDIPLEATGGALIADVAVDTGRSLVLDASQFNLADRRRFAHAFGEQLWKRKKGERHPTPLHLVIEESQLIIPQDVRGDVARMVGIYEEIIRLGRNYGIGVSMITQRPQSVNKEVLNQTECLFVGQVNGAQERKALGAWITHQGMDKALVDELPALPVGTFYVWSPQWLQTLEKVRILPKQTYDASATPKVGSTRVQRDMKPLDLKELESALAATIERAKADDPKALRAELARVKRDYNELRTRAERTLDQKPPKEVPVLKAAQIERLEKVIGRLEALQTTLADTRTEVVNALHAARTTSGSGTPAHRPHNDGPPLVARPAVRLPTVASERRGKPNRGTVGSDGGLDAAQRKILETVEMLHRRGLKPNRVMVARWLGIHPNGGRYGSNLARLREAGRLDSEWLLGGDPERPPFETLPTGLDALSDVLDGAQLAIVAALHTRTGQSFTRETLAEHLGIHPNGGRYGSNLARLREMGLIPERGPIQLTAEAYA